MNTMEDRAEAIIAKWLEYNDSWLRADDPEYPTQRLGRNYVMSHNTQEMHHEHAGTIVTSVYVAVDDELNNATLLGVFETLDSVGKKLQPPELVFVAAEVDTEWRDFYSDGKFTNTPD